AAVALEDHRVLVLALAEVLAHDRHHVADAELRRRDALDHRVRAALRGGVRARRDEREECAREKDEARNGKSHAARAIGAFDSALTGARAHWTGARWPLGASVRAPGGAAGAPAGPPRRPR